MAQISNPELTRNLSPDFHRRNDLALNHAHSIAFIQNIPGLIGLWPHADRDLSGYTNTCTGSGTVKTNVYDNNIVPYAQFDISGSAYTFHADSALFDITGDEGWVDSSYHGLTMGGWWQISNLGVTNEGLMAKFNAAGNQKAYRLYVGSASSLINFTISSDGSTNSNNLATSFSPTNDTWFYCVAWWNPSTEMRIYYGLQGDADLTMENTTASVAATIFNSSDIFSIGAMHAGSADFLEGRSSMTFLVRGRVPEIYIETIFDLTSPLFAAT